MSMFPRALLLYLCPPTAIVGFLWAGMADGVIGGILEGDSPGQRRVVNKVNGDISPHLGETC